MYLTSVPVLEQGLLYWEGASGKRQVTADNVGYNENLLHFSHQIFLCIIKRPFNKKYRYLTEARQFHSALVFAEQEWTKSFTTGGFGYVP